MKQNKLVIAITGLIGSGKSFLMQILKEYGEICISCDEINRELLNTPEYLEGLKKLFPEAFVSGEFEKEILKNLIFTSEKKRKILNNYAHSKIKYELQKRINIYDNVERIFVEIPILNQTDFIEMFDKIIVVKADRNLLLSRIKSRDKVGEDRALSMLDAQCDQYNFTVPTISIFNNGDKNVLQQQLEKILNNG